MLYILKDLKIDTILRSVHRNNTAIKLPDLSFDVLIKLTESAPKAVSIHDLSKEVWQVDHVSDETITQRITLLRKALGDNPKDPVYIRTVRGLGYAIIGSTMPAKNVPAKKRISFLNTRNLSLGVAGLITVSLATFLFLNVERNKAEHEDSVVEVSAKSTIMILVERARALLNLHQARETNLAIDLLNDALTQEPKNFNARLSLSFALSTRVTKFGGSKIDQTQAEAIARSLTVERPESSNAWSALGYALDSQGRSNESLPAYQHAYQLDPKNAPALSSAAHTHLMLGDLYQALILETRVMQSGNSSRYSEIQISQIMELIDHPSLAKWQAKALSLNPGQVVVLSEISRSYLRQGKPRAAIAILAQADGNDQSAPSILYLRGRAAIMLGNIEQARELLELAGDEASFDIAALNATIGEMSQAETMLGAKKVTEIEESIWPGGRVHLAEISAALGRDDDALRFLTQAVNLGWRDANWLKQSPFLKDFMLSSEGHLIENRIQREIDAQRLLIFKDEKLKIILGFGPLE